MVFFLFKCLNSRSPRGREKWKSARKLTDEEVLYQKLTKKHTQDSPFVEMLRSSTKLCEKWRRLLFPFAKLTQPNMQ